MAIKLEVRLPHTRNPPGEAASFEFEQARVVIGRSAGADVRLPDLAVSEIHATIEQRGIQHTLRDEGSTNGTQVNDVALVANRPRAIGHGDRITIGPFAITFVVGPLMGIPTGPERTASLARRMVLELIDDEGPAGNPPMLRVTHGPDAGTVVNLPAAPSTLIIGRGDEADLVLADPDVSRAHAEVVRDIDAASVRDLSSKNGLVVNGKRLRERRLRSGDQVRLGGTVVVYEDPAEQALKGLEGKPDATLTHEAQAPVLQTEQPPAPGSDSMEADPVAPVQSLPPGPESARSAADMVVYGLAFVVLVASLIGLAWLFGP